MLGKLQQTGAQVQVDDGSIHVMQSATMIEKGDTITADDAEILNQLGIEPLEIGLDLNIAFNEGELFTADELDIDTEEYRTDVESAASLAFNLAVNAGVVNETTAGTIVGEAAQKAKNLSISEGIPTDDTIEEIISHASSNAEGLDSQVDTENIDPEDEGENSEDEVEEESSEEESEETESEEPDEDSEDEEE
jgi:large subunit ribosomal protein L10